MPIPAANRYDQSVTVDVTGATYDGSSTTPREAGRLRRSFPTSPPSDATALGRLLRNHWTIETVRRCCLAVVVGNDQSRVRAGHGDENLAAVPRTAPDVRGQDRRVKPGVADKRLTAARDIDSVLAVVTGTPGPT